MTQIYRIALSTNDYTPPAPVYTHVCRAHLDRCTVETRHYDEAAARREAEWQAAKGVRAEVKECR